MIDYLPYDKSVQLYTQNQTIEVVDNCFAIMFTNVGDTIARIDQMVIFPNTNPATGLGDSRSFSGHRGDLYKGTKLTLSFNTPVGANPNVEVVQLYYSNVNTKLRGL